MAHQHGVELVNALGSMPFPDSLPLGYKGRRVAFVGIARPGLAGCGDERIDIAIGCNVAVVRRQLSSNGIRASRCFYIVRDDAFSDRLFVASNDYGTIDR